MNQIQTQPRKPRDARPQEYFTAIDGLRAIAILLVLFHHYWYQPLAYGLQLGNMGVDLFFVISGFLITGIVLGYRKLPLGAALKTFYVRRTLRIFPLYYLYIVLAAAIFWRVATSGELAYSALYAYNFFVITGGKGALPLGHFWSLAVEEQFYIVWPILMLTLPLRWIRPFIGASVLAGTAFAFYCMLAPVPFAAYMHPLSCMAALALGGLLAHLYANRGSEPLFLTAVARYSQLLLILALGGWAVSLKMQWYHPVLYPLLRTFSSIIAFILIARIIHPAATPNRADRWLDAFLRHPVMRFVGRISYGIYVYHFLVKYLLDPYFEEAIGPGRAYLVTAPLYTALTIGISYLSFRFIEAPINRLKDRFKAAEAVRK